MKVEIKDTQTGEIRTGYDKYDNVFNWSDNNFSCDCNRGMEFDRYGNDPVKDYECSAEVNRFLVNLFSDDGIELYREFKEPKNEQ